MKKNALAGTMQLDRGAHAPSRAVAGASPATRGCPNDPPFGDSRALRFRPARAPVGTRGGACAPQNQPHGSGLVPGAERRIRARTPFRNSESVSQPDRAKENSPPIYRWANSLQPDKSRQGRKNVVVAPDVLFRPSGAFGFSTSAYPAINRWAIFGCPSGTKTRKRSAACLAPAAEPPPKQRGIYAASTCLSAKAVRISFTRHGWRSVKRHKCRAPITPRKSSRVHAELEICAPSYSGGLQ